MTLESLELLPRGDEGWGSGVLKFGEHTTLLLGPNGAGKTPVLKALAYCLGHPVELPPLVRQRCRAARIVLREGEARFQIERELTPSGVEAAVSDSSGTGTLRDERTLSEWVLPKLGIVLRSLCREERGQGCAVHERCRPLMFLRGPGHGLDVAVRAVRGPQLRQGPTGRKSFAGCSTVRPRTAPRTRASFKLPRSHLLASRSRSSGKRRGLEALQRELGEDRAPGAAADRLEERRASLEADLQREPTPSWRASSRVESAQDVRVREAAQRREEGGYKLANAKRRKAQLLEVQAEVSAELGALEQNEIAADAFRAFCGNENCQFFRKPEESYGRRVLYLKDQLKDFESSAGEIERELLVLHQQLEAADTAAAKVAVEDKERSLERANGGAPPGRLAGDDPGTCGRQCPPRPIGATGSRTQATGGPYYMGSCELTKTLRSLGRPPVHDVMRRAFSTRDSTSPRPSRSGCLALCTRQTFLAMRTSTRSCDS